ncbi:MAG: hypothetical protein QM696_06855 [Steroidobacteraceae bacterium]
MRCISFEFMGLEAVAQGAIAGIVHHVVFENKNRSYYHPQVYWLMDSCVPHSLHSWTAALLLSATASVVFYLATRHQRFLRAPLRAAIAWPLTVGCLLAATLVLQSLSSVEVAIFATLTLFMFVATALPFALGPVHRERS